MKYHYEVTDIEWDAEDDFKEGEASLPSEIRFTADRKLTDDEVSDRISEETGFCHKGFKVKRTLMPICGNCVHYQCGKCAKSKQAVDEYAMAVCFKAKKEDM